MRKKKFVSVFLTAFLIVCSVLCFSIDAKALSIYAGLASGSSRYGIKAYILAPSAYPNVSSSGESAWVSTNKNSSGKWIQAGVRYYSGYSNMKTYVETYINGIYTMNEVGIHLLTANIDYKVSYNTSSSVWNAYIAGNSWASSTEVGGTIPVQAHGEVHQSGIQMGPFAFSQVQVQQYPGSWVTPSGTLHATSPYHYSGTKTSFTVYGP